MGDRVPIDILEDLLAQIEAAPGEPYGCVLFLREGILNMTRAAIAAETELTRLGHPAE